MSGREMEAELLRNWWNEHGTKTHKEDKDADDFDHVTKLLVAAVDYGLSASEISKETANV